MIVPEVPGVEVQLVDEHGKAVAADAAGEIEVRGPGVFKEYWGKPQATQEAFDLKEAHSTQRADEELQRAVSVVDWKGMDFESLEDRVNTDIINCKSTARGSWGT